MEIADRRLLGYEVEEISTPRQNVLDTTVPVPAGVKLRLPITCTSWAAGTARELEDTTWLLLTRPRRSSYGNLETAALHIVLTRLVGQADIGDERSSPSASISRLRAVIERSAAGLIWEVLLGAARD